MNQREDISKADCERIAAKIRLDIFKPANTFKTSVFLCGADISKTEMIRFNVAEKMTSFRNSYLYDLIYPEDIFEELLNSSKTDDLLSLEHLLAESVDAIVLIPESPGSFAELGAFANDEILRYKLVCLVDKQFKANKSFINQGPLKLVRKANKNAVIYIDPDDIGAEVDKLNTILKKMKKASGKVNDKITLLQIENFLLPSIYLLEPISKQTLINLVASATGDEKNAFQSTTTSLTIMTKKRLVELTPLGYKLTTLGVKDFFSFRHKKSRVKTQRETVIIDELRLEILNLKNRKKKLKV